MSLKLLRTLNGKNKGRFSEFLNELTSEPEIAWYPSAGEDFQDLILLNDRYSKKEIGNAACAAPDIFLHTDYFPWKNTKFLESEIIQNNKNAKITISEIEELPSLNLPLNSEIVHFTEGSEKTGKVFYLNLQIETLRLGTFNCRLLYAFVVNEPFYAKIVRPNQGRFSHIIRVIYGNGFGGGHTSGIWLLNILKEVDCKIFITDNRHFSWLESADSDALKLYPELGTTEMAAFDMLNRNNMIHITSDWNSQDLVSWHKLE
jgi:hypothetical protein